MVSRTILENKYANKTENLITELTDVNTLYSKQNLAGASLFAGGFINFGYWKGIETKPKISLKNRALSSKQMYKLICRRLAIRKNDSVLEIGCGLGNGCVMLHKIYNPKYVIGIDATNKQIQRALKKHKPYIDSHRDSIKFFRSNAESIQISPGTISKCFSVEALQHFESIDSFLSSVFSVLKSRGKLVVTTFFFKVSPPVKFFDQFPNFASGVDKIVKTEDFSQKLKAHGFKGIKCRSIGKFVWNAFDRWIAQTEYRDTWDKNWIKAYKEGILDYYVFEMYKP